MKIAALQLSAQGLSSTKLYKYIRNANRQGVKLLLLGEYVLNPFFKELETLSISMIKEQAQNQIKVLKELAQGYDLTIVAPIVLVKRNKLYKTVAKFAPNSTSYYHQQILINYPHWNEEKYFSNEIAPLETPLVFKVDKIKFAVISGFEIHFDEVFAFLKNKNIDCLLVPSVSTFDSYERWKSLLQTRAFTNNFYILRANRIGEYQEKDFNWEFYGDSLFIAPNGEIVEHLGNKEEFMIAQLEHSEVIKAKKLWGFAEQIKKRS